MFIMMNIKAGNVRNNERYGFKIS